MSASSLKVGTNYKGQKLLMEKEMFDHTLFTVLKSIMSFFLMA